MFERTEIIYIEGKPAYGSFSIDLAKELKLDTSLFGPSTIGWEKIVDYSSPLEYLNEKEQKKIKKSLTYAQEAGITINMNKVLSEDDYQQWVKIYKKNMDNKATGTAWIDENWLRNLSPKIAEKYGSIMIKDNKNNVIGGTLIKHKDKNNSISCDFRAHEYIKFKESSLSAFLEYAIDDYALKFGYTRITRGADENLYGIRLSKGLNEFKRHYRFTPIPLDDHGTYRPRVLVFFQEYENVLTYCYKDHQGSKDIEPVLINKTLPVKFEI